MLKITRTIEEHNMVPFGEKLAGSESFKSLFKEGMALVEEAAAYLDGPGRKEAKLLARSEALAYAAESMRLTTRLMQLASWLLLQRAVNEGELTQNEAASEKHKVKLARQDLASDAEAFTRLPARLQELAIQSLRLQARIDHLDRVIYPPEAPSSISARPPAIEIQLNRLREAFQQG